MLGTFLALMALIPGSRVINSRIDRGHENLIRDNDLYVIRKAIESICDFDYSKATSQPREDFLLNLSIRDLSLYVSQLHTNYLLNSLLFNRAIANYYASNTSLVFPLNKNWQKIFKNYGIKSNKYLCLVLWKFYVVILIFRNLRLFVRQCKESNISKFSSKDTQSQASEAYANVYFYDISLQNLPSTNGVEFEKNLVTWYQKYVLMENPINVLHNVKGHDFKFSTNSDIRFTYNQTLFFNISFSENLQAIFWYLKVLLKNFTFVTKNVNLLLIFRELIDAKKAHGLRKKLNLTAVVFNNSIGSTKPLWAVVLEKKKVRLDFCFYACYAEPLDIQSNFPIDGYWKLATWNNYYVCDNYQSIQLSSQLNHKPLHIYKDIVPWWSDANINIENCPDNSIVLFDTVLPSYVYTLGTLNQFGWLKFEIAKNFLLYVLETAQELDLIVFYKLKRIRDKKHRNNEHWNYIQDSIMKFKKNIVHIDDRVAPERLIQNSGMTISKPLSTTAIIAKQMGKPSVYLDPSKGLSRTDPALRGIDLVQGKKELKLLVEEIFFRRMD